MKFRTILLFGAPGAGKGTQGRILGSVPRFFHFACGDVFRGLTAETPIGRLFLEYSTRGELVPDEPTIELWRQSIDTHIRSGRFRPDQDTLVLDGIPRNPRQAEILKESLAVLAIFYLRSTDVDNLVKRMQRRAITENRPDDVSLDVIRERLKNYERETKPVLSYYGKDVVHRINADQTPEKVLFDILRRITKV
jgi:adenylate kinase